VSKKGVLQEFLRVRHESSRRTDFAPPASGGPATTAGAELEKLHQLLELEERIDFEAASRERDALIDFLKDRLAGDALRVLVEKSAGLKAGTVSEGAFCRHLTAAASSHDVPQTPNLTEYTSYRGMFEGLDFLRLFDELEDYEEAVMESLLLNKNQKKLYGLERHLNAVVKILRGEATAADFDFYSQSKDETDRREIRKSLYGLSSRYGVSHDLDGDLERIFEKLPQAAAFYRTAKEREAFLVKNALGRMKEKGAQVAVLVSGGFHTRGLTDLLKNDSVSHMVLMPKCGEDKRPYIAVLTRHQEEFGELKEQYEIAFGTAFDDASAGTFVDPSQKRSAWRLYARRLLEGALKKLGTSGKAVADLTELTRRWRENFSRQSPGTLMEGREFAGIVEDSQFSVFCRMTGATGCKNSDNRHNFFRKSYWLNTNAGIEDAYDGAQVFNDYRFEPKPHCLKEIMIHGNKATTNAFQPFLVYKPPKAVKMKDTITGCSGLFQMETIDEGHLRDLAMPHGDSPHPGIPVVQHWDLDGALLKNFFEVDFHQAVRCQDGGGPCVHATVGITHPAGTGKGVWPNPTPKFQTKLYP